MNLLGNMIWVVCGGAIAALAWACAGVILCITVIGIPFGLQCFKIAEFVVWPFGRDISVGHFGTGGLVLNILWIVLFGWEFAMGHLVLGLAFCITIIGIPFGMQHFKLAKLGLVPFGAEITQG